MKVMDNILLNLKIISKIPEHGRIKRSETGSIALEEQTRLKSITRFLTRDNRAKAVEDINTTIDFSIEKCNDITNSKYFTEHNKFNINDSFITKRLEDEYFKQYELLELIFNELKKSLKGIINLKTTYYKDATTVSKLDITISKIKNYILDLEKKVFNNFNDNIYDEELPLP